MQRTFPPPPRHAPNGTDDSSLTVTHSHQPSGVHGGERSASLPYMTLLDRFELTRPIGMGASGAVFEAVDRSTSQTIALKLLHRCEPTDLYRVKGEFRALAELAHPNLVA